MWEAIRQNRRRSYLLIGLLAIILIALGATIGTYVAMQQGAVFGVGIALLVWFVLWLVAAAGGDRILLSSEGAHQIQKEDAPQLWNVVEEMTIASGLPRMPRVYVIDDDAPNAFAVGRKPEKAAVAVTSGLLRRLDRDELQGVIGHEIGHIRNLDIRFMTLAGVMVGSIALISDAFLRGLYHGGGRRRSSSIGGGQAQAIMLLIAIALAILGPICAQLLYLACSRRREYLADASAARFTRYPEGLASALEKIASRVKLQEKPNRAVAPMYIVNPLQATAGSGLSSTHPPTETRIRILRSMGGQAGLAAYEAAHRQITGGRQSCLDARTLKAAESVAARRPTPKPEAKPGAVTPAREVTDLLDRLADYLFLSCACGLRIKVPPTFQQDTLACPRCGRRHELPVAALAAAATVAKAGGTVAAKPRAMRYQRKGPGWESFRCRCGHAIQISPSFGADSVRCRKCGGQILIAAPGR